MTKEEARNELVLPMRDATPEELKSVNDYIKNISKPTGVNFDFDEEQEQIDFVQPHKTVGKLISVDVLDKIRADIEDTLYVDSLIFGELIDFRNGKISADDVIEEFNRVTRLEVLRIIDKYKNESEE